jgi:ANTAR domain
VTGYRPDHSFVSERRTDLDPILGLPRALIGALNFFDTSPGALDVGKLRIGQALADVATIGLLQQRAIRRSGVLTEQLQTALNRRVLIEQAKGILAERLNIDLADAFNQLRQAARSHNRRLSDVAQALIDGEQIPPATNLSRTR